MPDPPSDALLRQLAANQFYAGISDPRSEAANVLRAVMGLKAMEPTGPLPFDALQSSESVDVSAPEPTGGFPRNMDQVLLGSKTSKPTGTHAPPMAEPNVSEDARELWQIVAERYPHAKGFVSSVTRRPLPPGVAGEHADGAITLSPRADADTLIHELAHAAAAQQFTTPGARMANHAAGGGAWGADYRNRRGERVARAVEQSARARESQESQARMVERMRRQKADYLAGRGPKPNWM